MIRSKLPDVGTTIFTVMSKLSIAHNAINLGQGFPDFNPDSQLITLVNKYFSSSFNQYAPMEGVVKLREQISSKIFNSYATNFSPETEITLTNGATEAVFVAISTLVHPGDEVILFEPMFDVYVPGIELCGGKPVYVPLEGESFKINWQRVEAAITPKTKVIIINSPHNPTGAMLKKEDILKLSDLANKHNLFIISDEVYEHIVFDGQPHESVLKYLGLRERSLAIFSFGKTLHATGWRLGYCIGAAPLMKEFRKIHQFVTFAANTPLQYAIAEYLETNKSYLELSALFGQKRDKFRSLLSSTPFRLLPCEGSYFQLVSYEAISKQKDTDFAIWLAKEIGVASIPISPFYSNKKDNHIIRFCFAKSDAVLIEATERLRKAQKTE